MSDLHAKIRLEEFLRKKHLNFHSLEVHKCTEDFFGLFDHIFK